MVTIQKLLQSHPKLAFRFKFANALNTPYPEHKKRANFSLIHSPHMSLEASVGYLVPHCNGRAHAVPS